DISIPFERITVKPLDWLEKLTLAKNPFRIGYEIRDQCEEMERGMLKSRELFCTIVLALGLVGVLPAQAVSSLNVNIFSGFNCCSGDGSPYSNLVGSFTAPDIQFATNPGYSWHPFGLSDFGADITGSIDVSTVGTY